MKTSITDRLLAMNKVVTALTVSVPNDPLGIASHDEAVLLAGVIHKELLILRGMQIDKVGGALTAGERRAGYHFCPDWDFMLIGPHTDELAVCTCPVKACGPDGSGDPT